MYISGGRTNDVVSGVLHAYLDYSNCHPNLSRDIGPLHLTWPELRGQGTSPSLHNITLINETDHCGTNRHVLLSKA